MKIYQESKKIKGLNEEELNEAMRFYTDKVISDVLIDMENTYNIRLELAEELIPYFQYAIELGMTKGMELAANTDKLIDFYSEYKGKEIDQVNYYDFEINKGISGILLPNGEFFQCGNAEHHLIAEKVAKGQEFGCIYFSSRLWGQDDGVLSYSPIGFRGVTQAQKEWMKKNEHFFDKGQISMYKDKILNGLEQ